MISNVSYQAYTAANSAVNAALVGKTYGAAGGFSSTGNTPQPAPAVRPGSAKPIAGSPPQPASDSIGKLASDLSGSLGTLFAGSGIAAPPAVTFEVNPNTGYVTVTGNRPDIAQIERTVNANPTVALQIRNLSAIGSQTAGFAETRRTASRPAASGAQYAVAQYASIYQDQQRPAAISLAYDGSAVTVNADGRPWAAADATA